MRNITFKVDMDLAIKIAKAHCNSIDEDIAEEQERLNHRQDPSSQRIIKDGIRKLESSKEELEEQIANAEKLCGSDCEFELPADRCSMGLLLCVIGYSTERKGRS